MTFAGFCAIIARLWQNLFSCFSGFESLLKGGSIMHRPLLVFSLAMLSVAAFAAPSSAVPPDVDWIKTYGDTGDEIAYWIEECSGGGYMVTGYIEDLKYGTNDVLLMKLDTGGDTLWVRTYGDDLDQVGTCVKETGDHGFIITGFTETSTDGLDAYFVRTDPSGDTLWTNNFDFDGDEILYCVEVMPDGSFMSVGFTSGIGDPSLTDVLLLKIDADGGGIWKEYYVGPGHDRGLEVCATGDGNCVLVGYTEDASGDSDVLLVKFDPSDGDSIWTRAYGDTTRDIGSGLSETYDGGLIAGGGRLNYHDGWGAAYIIRTDANGDTLWTRSYGGPGENNYVYSVAETAELGFICGCRGDTSGTGDSDFLFIKTDASGDTLWFKMVGDGEHQSPTCMATTSDMGYVAAGYTRALPAGDRDIQIVKLEGDVAGTDLPEAEVPRPLLALEGPNPCPAAIALRYDVASASHVHLAVYDVAGRRVATLEKGHRRAGSHRATWDCTDMSGRAVMSGLYFVRYECGDCKATRKVLILR
jgi:hypothetical protein